MYVCIYIYIYINLILCVFLFAYLLNMCVCAFMGLHYSFKVPCLTGRYTQDPTICGSKVSMSGSHALGNSHTNGLGSRVSRLGLRFKIQCFLCRCVPA